MRLGIGHNRSARHKSLGGGMRRNATKNLREDLLLDTLEAGLGCLDQPAATPAFLEPAVSVVAGSDTRSSAALPEAASQPGKFSRREGQPAGDVVGTGQYGEAQLFESPQLAILAEVVPVPEVRTAAGEPVRELRDEARFGAVLRTLVPQRDQPPTSTGSAGETRSRTRRRTVGLRHGCHSGLRSPRKEPPQPNQPTHAVEDSRKPARGTQPTAMPGKIRPVGQNRGKGPGTTQPGKPHRGKPVRQED